MKKNLLILILSLFFVAFAGEYIHYGFTVKCAKCVELYEKDKTISKNIAWRTFHYKSENGKTYALYRCQGGHNYWAKI